MSIFDREVRKDFSAYTDFEIQEHEISMSYGSKKYEYILKKYVGGDSVVNIPEGVNVISYYAFRDCDTVREIHLPISIDEVSGSAFSACHNLEKIVFEGRWARLADSAFSGAPSPLKVVYPGLSTEWEAKVRSTTVSENSYDNGWGGSAPGLYSRTYTSNPMGHALGEKFVIEAFCEGDGKTVMVCGTSSGGKLVSESTPYDR